MYVYVRLRVRGMHVHVHVLGRVCVHVCERLRLPLLIYTYIDQFVTHVYPKV